MVVLLAEAKFVLMERCPERLLRLDLTAVLGFGGENSRFLFSAGETLKMYVRELKGINHSDGRIQTQIYQSIKEGCEISSRLNQKMNVLDASLRIFSPSRIFSHHFQTSHDPGGMGVFYQTQQNRKTIRTISGIGA